MPALLKSQPTKLQKWSHILFHARNLRSIDTAFQADHLGHLNFLSY